MKKAEMTKNSYGFGADLVIDSVEKAKR